MFRFVAVSWEPRSKTRAGVADMMDARMRAHLGPWEVVLKQPGLLVYCAGVRAGSSEVYLLENGSGVVLGTVFTRIADGDGIPIKATFGPRETTRVLSSDGRALVEDYWGRYVAFLRSPNSGEVRVVRSPTGGLDCLTLEIDGLRIFCSGTEHCPLIDLRTFSLNWGYLAAHIAAGVPDTPETGLNEIERVLQGECVNIVGKRLLRSTFWRPSHFVRQPPMDDPRLASSELLRVTRACTHAWASCYSNIVTMLSGGLDSSILVGVLRHAPNRPDVVCLNYHNPYDPTSDERRYARQAAERAGYTLIEHEQSPSFSLEPILTMPRTDAPWLSIYGVGEVEQRADLARRYQTQAWFVGHNGDEVFFRNAASYHCADFVHRYGLRPRVLSIALEAARMSHRALWPTLWQGVREGMSKRGADIFLKEFATLLPLLNKDVLESVQSSRRFLPSWLQDCEDLPPGKCSQINGLSGAGALHYLYAPDDDPEVVHPLASQPMLELCLNIPTHVLAHGGRSRGLASLAFAAELPPEIARRKSKGAVQDYLKAIWTVNKSLINSYLLDGMLMREGLLDKARLSATLSGSLAADYTVMNRITILFCAEAWVRNWSTHRQRLAA